MIIIDGRRAPSSRRAKTEDITIMVRSLCKTLLADLQHAGVDVKKSNLSGAVVMGLLAVVQEAHRNVTYTIEKTEISILSIKYVRVANT